MRWEGSVIQYARISAGLTQIQLSEELEIPKRTIEDWECGKRIPPIYVAKLISYYLRNKKGR